MSETQTERLVQLIQSVMKEYELSQEDVAGYIGVSQGTVSKILQGLRSGGRSVPLVLETLPIDARFFFEKDIGDRTYKDFLLRPLKPPEKRSARTRRESRTEMDNVISNALREFLASSLGATVTSAELVALAEARFSSGPTVERYREHLHALRNPLPVSPGVDEARQSALAKDMRPLPAKKPKK